MSLEKEWLEADKKELNINEFKSLTEKIFAKKAEVELIEESLEQHKVEFNELMATAEKILLDSGLDSFKLPTGQYLSFKEYTSLGTPKEISDKKALGKYLEQKGIFWEMFGVNSQTLNSYFKAERDLRAGDDKLNFRLPGCGDPKAHRKLEAKKGKAK